MLHLSALYRFPLKSCKPEILRRATFDELGLAGDRRWMLVDADNGRFLTQRTVPGMSQLTVLWNEAGGVTLSAPGMTPLDVPLPADCDANLRGVTLWRDTFQVPDAGEAAAQWASAFVGKPVRVVHAPLGRARTLDEEYRAVHDKVAFADGFPLLLIGQGSLDELSARVGRPMEMLRFRPNLVVSGAEAFAEDGWKRIRIGDIQFRLVQPCARCIVTTIDPATGTRSEDREPFTTLRTFRATEGKVMFGQNVVSDGVGELEVGMPVEVLE